MSLIAKPRRNPKDDGAKRTDTQPRKSDNNLVFNDESKAASKTVNLVEDRPNEDDSDSNDERDSYATLLRLFPPSNRSLHPRKKRKIEVANDVELVYNPQPLSETHGDNNATTNVESFARHESEDANDLSQGSEVDEDSSVDPFAKHFSHPDEKLLSQRLNAISENQWSTEVIISASIRKLLISWPTSEDTDTSHLRKPLRSLKSLKLKSRLFEPASHVINSLDPIQSAIVPTIFNYHDLLFGCRTFQNAESLRRVASLHVLNHVYKTRDIVVKNTTRLAKEQYNADLDLRDQGFARPKVLILLETRQSCVRYMETIASLLGPEVQQENKKRFIDAFGQIEEKPSRDKPPDFLELFEKNDDNDFRLGVKFTRKTIKYYSQFYASDIILASPLGLRRAIKSTDKKTGKVVDDSDFLSSIEVLVIDQADAMLQQNWEHVLFAFSRLNHQPKEPHGCDFSRVRHWYLNGHARHLRQTIVFSAYITPELNALFAKYMQNISGKVKAEPEYEGALTSVALPVRQIFSRFDSRSPISDPDDRFDYFNTAVLPSLVRQQSALPKGDGNALGALIFIPSYLDFVRVRNHLAASSSAETAGLSFGAISEYTSLTDVRRARSHFLTGYHQVLLYTGRAHHFRRYRIKGVKTLVLYGLPDNPVFYTELVGGFLGDTVAVGTVDVDSVSLRAMFSRWDCLALERIVGTKRVGRMVKGGAGDTFEFR